MHYHVTSNLTHLDVKKLYSHWISYNLNKKIKFVWNGAKKHFKDLTQVLTSNLVYDFVISDKS